MKLAARLVTSPLLLAAIAACACAEAQTSAPSWPASPPPVVAPNHPAPGERVDLTFGSSLLSAHVADTPKEREVGLMEVDALGTDEGMIFVYPAAAARYYWMKDTLLPLSIAFVGEDGRIVRIADMRPGDTTLTPSQKPAAYAVEAPQGWFGAHGVKEGDAVGGLPKASRE
jgi:uncharacterized membrane protein (UPF0127 family)